MKIKELIKYVVIPLLAAVIYLFSYLFMTDLMVDNLDKAILITLIFFLLIIIFIVFLFLSLFVFFKNKEIPVLIIIASVFLLTVLPLKSVEFGSDEINTVLLLTLMIGYFVLMIRSIRKVRENRYLSFLLIFGGIAFLTDFFMFAVKLMDSRAEHKILIPVSIGLFLVFSFALIFTLPNSDYLDWKKEHRQFFMRTIIAPWMLILSLSIMNFIVNPSDGLSSGRNDRIHPFNMEKYEIVQKDGMD